MSARNEIQSKSFNSRRSTITTGSEANENETADSLEGRRRKAFAENPIRLQSNRGTAMSPKPWPMPPEDKKTVPHTSLLLKEQNTPDSEGDFKTPRAKFFDPQSQHRVSRTLASESPPLEVSPVQEVFFDDVDVPSSRSTLTSSLNTRDRKQAVGWEYKCEHEEKQRTPDVDSSTPLLFVDKYCLSPEEEVSPISEHESNTFKFLRDDEVSSSSEKSFKLPSGLKNLFSDSERNSFGQASFKGRTRRGLATESEFFSPRKSDDGLDEESESNGSKQGLSEPVALKTSSNPVRMSALRRPIGSRRKTVVDFSKPPRPQEISPKSLSGKVKESSITDLENVGSPKTSTNSSSSTALSQEQVKVISPLMTKGVIMRAHTHKTNVNGIRKAETGKIMSREELLGDRKSVFLRESPIPKSLNPAGFSEDDDVMTRRPSTLFQYSSSGSDGGIPNSKVGKMENDGSFLGDKASLGYLYQEVQSSSSSKFSESGSSSGLVNRLGSSFKKAKNVVVRRSATDFAELSNTDMVIPGTIDEAVCKICYVCRKKLECRVFVKNTGKKIKVESDNREKGYYLRASLFVRPLGGDEPACSVNIRQSRADGMKTSFATLWDFYQRMEKGLQELEAGNNR